MASLLLLFLAAVIFLAVAGVIGVIRGRIERHGFLVLAWRWLTGHPWHGKAITDAGWLRPGTKALTRTGHAPRFHHRPRLHRTAMRSGTVLTVLLSLLGLLTHPAVTLGALAALALAGLTLAAVRAWRRWLTRDHRRGWIEPLHVAVAPILHVPVEASASYLTVEPDRNKATISLPPGWHGTQQERDRLVAVVRAKLGMVEQPDVSWELKGPAHHLVVEEIEPPPVGAKLADIREAIDRAKPRELVIGPGKRGQMVTVSLDNNSPHVGASMGTGGGKSTLGRLLLAQHLHSGGFGLVIDAKMLSHPWVWGLPNCACVDTPEAMHEALMWLAEELPRRNRVAKASTDVAGVMHGNPGAPLMILAEELNMTTPRLRAYWRELSGEGKSPALQAQEDVAFAGRQVQMHLVLIGQMLSAKATSSGEARENIGIRILARYTERNWKMLAPEHPMPLASGVNGRVQVVASGKVREAQVAELTPLECRELALSGIVTPLPAGMPGRTVTPAIGRPQAEIEAAAQAGKPVTLTEAVRAGILPMGLAGARTARHRDESFPEPVDVRGSAHLYDPRALAEYARSRT